MRSFKIPIYTTDEHGASMQDLGIEVEPLISDCVFYRIDAVWESNDGKATWIVAGGMECCTPLRLTEVMKIIESAHLDV